MGPVGFGICTFCPHLARIYPKTAVKTSALLAGWPWRNRLHGKKVARLDGWPGQADRVTRIDGWPCLACKHFNAFLQEMYGKIARAG